MCRHNRVFTENQVICQLPFQDNNIQISSIKAFFVLPGMQDLSKRTQRYVSLHNQHNNTCNTASATTLQQTIVTSRFNF
jgi:hypothetical protein